MTESWPGVAMTAAGAAITSYLIVALVRKTVAGYLLDHPNARSSHSTPTPRGGGIGIVVAATAGSFIGNGSAFSHVLALALGIALVSLIDDLYSLGTVMRFAVHAVAALVLILFSGHWREVKYFGAESTGGFVVENGVLLGAAGVVITFLWVIGLTNAYNFMDGIDGIAGTQAIVAAAGWYFLSTGASPWTNMMSVLVGASALGFLFHNWPPAAIFMGDVGSAFLGFTFAAIGVIEGVRDPRLIIPAILVVWPFVFDSLLTFFRRLARGERIYEAHRSHLYQRLVRSGLSHQVVTLIYGIAAAVTTTAALTLHRGISGAALWASLIVPAVSIALVGITFLRERRVRT